MEITTGKECQQNALASWNSEILYESNENLLQYCTDYLNKAEVEECLSFMNSSFPTVKMPLFFTLEVFSKKTHSPTVYSGTVSPVESNIALNTIKKEPNSLDISSSLDLTNQTNYETIQMNAPTEHIQKFDSEDKLNIKKEPIDDVQIKIEPVSLPKEHFADISNIEESSRKIKYSSDCDSIDVTMTEQRVADAKEPVSVEKIATINCEANASSHKVEMSNSSALTSLAKPELNNNTGHQQIQKSGSVYDIKEPVRKITSSDIVNLNGETKQIKKETVLSEENASVNIPLFAEETSRKRKYSDLDSVDLIVTKVSKTKESVPVEKLPFTGYEETVLKVINSFEPALTSIKPALIGHINPNPEKPISDENMPGVIKFDNAIFTKRIPVINRFL